MTTEAHGDGRIGTLGLIQRIGLFVLIGWLGLLVFAILSRSLDVDVLISSAFSSFCAAAVANATLARIYERGRLADFGLGWERESGRELLVGVGMGAWGGVLVMGIPLLSGIAHLEPVPSVPAHRVAALGLVLVALLFGASGEEMLFHGYGFQVLARALGPFATILPVAVVFGMAHVGNQHSTLLGVFNTFAWGVLLGYARWRSGALWLPIGLHFGWNATMPLFGANLSGFTIGVTGYALHWSIGPLWSGGEYGPEGGLETTIVVAALMWVVTRTGRR